MKRVMYCKAGVILVGWHQNNYRNRYKKNRCEDGTSAFTASNPVFYILSTLLLFLFFVPAAKLCRVQNDTDKSLHYFEYTRPVELRINQRYEIVSLGIT